MKKNLEIEYKTLVNEAQFTKLKEACGYDVLLQQTNVYYDTIPSLSDRLLTMRIRDIKDKHWFTLKVPQQDGLMEYEMETLTNDPSVLNQPQFLELFESLDIHGPFHVSGQMKTNRFLKKEKLGELCMDHSLINGVDDYEIEFEAHGCPQEALIYFTALLKKMGIAYIPNKQSKFVRCVLNNK